MTPPPRSLLYVPASNARAIEKARALASDAVILDLEDAVSGTAKDEARGGAAVALAGGMEGRRIILRVNPLGTAEGDADLAALGTLGWDAILFPKIRGAREAAAARASVPGTAVWAMIETPLAIVEVAAIAAVGVGGLVAGWNDLALECGLAVSPDRRELWHAMSAMVLAARAHGAHAFDGVPLALRDAEVARGEAAQARAFGFDGKTLVHPDQIAPCHEGFAPSPLEQSAAQSLLQAWEARPSGAGVIQHAGRLVEALHAEAARRLLARV